MNIDNMLASTTFLKNKNISMDMIGHYDERAQFHIWEMIGDFIPPFQNDYAILVEVHFTPDDFPE